MVKIVALGGSLRPNSLSYHTLELALRKAEGPDISTQMIDLRLFQLPFCNGGALYPNYPDVDSLRLHIQSAQAIIVCSPEYHGGMSGVLKNALDLLDERHLAGKVVGLIAVAGGVSSTNALNMMRIICRQLHCWVLPDQLVVPYSDSSFNEVGEFKDRILESRLEEMIAHLVHAVRRFV